VIWRALVTPPARAAWNMACDHVLAEAVGRGESSPLLRFFGWAPPAVSLGHNQPLRGREGAVRELRRRGYDVVRRPTGGAAVLHSREVTYSVALPPDTPFSDPGPRFVCARIHAAILRGLGFMGVEGLTQEGFDPARNGGAGRAGSGAQSCFAAASRSEIVWQGRKLVGSAQRRLGRAILQHGSILLEGDQEALRQVWPEAADQGRFVTLSEAGGRRFEFEEVAEAVRRGFESELGVAFADGTLDPAEVRGVESLVRTCYARHEHLFRI
jgi:lipoyl(octanoyl) transferase